MARRVRRLRGLRSWASAAFTSMAATSNCLSASLASPACTCPIACETRRVAAHDVGSRERVLARHARGTPATRGCSAPVRRCSTAARRTAAEAPRPHHAAGMRWGTQEIEVVMVIASRARPARALRQVPRLETIRARTLRSHPRSAGAARLVAGMCTACAPGAPSSRTSRCSSARRRCGRCSRRRAW